MKLTRPHVRRHGYLKADEPCPARMDREIRFELSDVEKVTSPMLERKFFIGNLLVRIHFIIVMIRWTGLAPWELEFPFPGSLISTFVETHGPRDPLRAVRRREGKNNYLAEM